MKTDRSGRTLEDYRQLYWDEQERNLELEAQVTEIPTICRRYESRLKAAGYMVCDKHPYLTTTSPTASALGCPYCKLDAVKGCKRTSWRGAPPSKYIEYFKVDDVLAEIGEQE